jgi:hypothetical protein
MIEKEITGGTMKVDHGIISEHWVEIYGEYCEGDYDYREE